MLIIRITSPNVVMIPQRPLRLIYGHYSPLGAYNTLRLCDLNKPSSIPPTPSTPKALKKSHSVDLSSPAGRPSKKVWNEFSDFEMKILSIDKFWTFLRDFGVSPIFCRYYYTSIVIIYL